MLQDNVVIEVEKRAETGKNAANRLRAADKIPAVLYGGGKGMETMSLCVPRKALVTFLRKGLHGNAIFQLKLKGTDQQRHVMIRDLSIHPVSRAVQHVDFVRILLDKKLKVKTPVEAVGTAVGVKEGGLLNVVTHELQIECLPADIPASIKIDVSHLNLHENVRVQDLKLGDEVKVLEPADRVILHVVVPRAEEVAPAAAAAAEGAAAATPSAEPEVIKKGKKEEEGAAAEAPAKPAEKGAKK